MFSTNIEICGRDIIYVSAINEFCEKYSKIELIILNVNFYLKHKKELDLLIQKLKYKEVIILYDKKIDNMICSSNAKVYSYEEFLNIQKNMYVVELKEDEMQLGQDVEISNTINNDLNINDLSGNQINFLETNLGRAVNIGLDIGIRALLPNVVEDGVIAVKDAILENGFKEGIKQSIDDVIEISKAAGNVLNGKYDNIEQIQLAVKTGGLIDSFSGLLDIALKFANQMGGIDQTTYQILKAGKNTILNTISSKIDDELTNQLKYVQKVQNYSNKWKDAYENKDFNEMEKAYKNMESYLEKTIPFENTLNEARIVENMHNLIKNNGKNFNLSETELELAKRLIN